MKNGSFLEEHFLFFLCLCILTERIYGNFIKTTLYVGKIMGYNKGSPRGCRGKTGRQGRNGTAGAGFPVKIIDGMWREQIW